MTVALFLGQVIGISLSGVMAPGPVTALAIASGARNRFSGVLIAIGHGIVEFPLMAVILLGAGKFLQSGPARIGIGLVGGSFLLLMGTQMLRSLRSRKTQETFSTKLGPLTAGIVLSGGNPYFLMWWASVGLVLATKATTLGIWVFALFAIIHWLCDLAWLTLLSWASFKGAHWLGKGVQDTILMICGGALLLFGVFFLFDAFKAFH